MVDARIKQAEKMEKSAKAAGKRNVLLFKFTPDYDTAAVEYEKAAKLYRATKNKSVVERAITCFQKAAEFHYKNGILFRSAKCYESAGQILKEQNKLEAALKKFEKAAITMLEDGKGDRAAEILTKAAKMYEGTGKKGKIDPQIADKVSDLFRRALEHYKDDDKYYLSTQAYINFTSFLVGQERYNDAVENMKEQVLAYKSLDQKHNIWRVFLSMVIVLLENDDWVAAEERHLENKEAYPEFAAQEECLIAQRYLDAFEQMDMEALEECKKIRLLKYLPARVGKIARNMSLSKKKKTQRKPVKKETVSKQDQDNLNELLGDADQQKEEEAPVEVDEEEEGDPLDDSDDDMR